MQAQQQQHTALKLLAQGDLVAVQPAAARGPTTDTLSVQLSSGRVTVSQAPLLSGNSSSSTQQVLALVGCFTFKAGTVLAAVTKAEQVAVLRGEPVFRVQATKLIKPDATFDAGEQRLLSYLTDALNPVGSGRNLFFAYNTDLTLSTQALSDVLAAPSSASKSIAGRADRRFFWNRVMAAPLLGAGGDAFVLPMIVGSISQLSDVEASAHGKSVRLSLTLIARRALDRAGTRHWRRGADTEGYVANFVETEQLVTLDDGRIVASYVQCRGSIPLLWTQLPNIKYKPPTKLLEGGATSAAFDAHFDALLREYNAVSCINLVNQHGSEGTLEAAMARESSRYSSTQSAALTYTAFDFHKQCGATNYGRLSVLWEAISPEYKRFGQFLTGTQHNRRQEGVFRTNCVDCLDRTNVVQGLLARHALQDLLGELGVLAAGESLETVLPAVEVAFKGMWADHGDDLGRQYAGTGALKSGFTRTGKRTLAGLLDDGLKSVTRYYLNNFKDGHKQDALDLVSGAFKVKRDVKLQFRRQHSPAVPILLALVALGYALTSLGHVGSLLEGSGSSSSGGGSSGSRDGLLVVGQHVLAPLLLAGGLIALVQANGRQLVDRPQLCPALANTVGRPETFVPATKIIMSRAAEQRKRIKQLERQRAKLESEFGSLVHRRQCLLLQNAILTAWCDAFTLVQASSGGWMAPAPRTAAAGAATAGTAAQQQQDDNEAVRERFHELLREEIMLLNELTARDRVGNCPLGAASSALPDPGPNTLSPGDPMAFFRNVVAEGPCPEAAAWTVHDVASFLRETTLLSSLYLSMVHASPHAASTGNRQQAIKELWDRHCRGLMSLIMLGRQDVAQALCTWNLETMDQRPEYGKAAEQLTTTLPARMHLTDLQRELIPAAIEVFDSLDAALQQQWKEVTARMGAAAAAAESAAAADRAECGDVAVAASSQGLQPANEAARAAAAAAAAAAAGGSSGSNGGSSSSSSSNGTRLLLRGFSSRQEHLEVQQQLAARMKLVMAKQYLLALTMMSLIVGCLTYEQVTLISVMSWPHPVRPLHLGKAIAKYVAQELASSASGHLHGSGASDTHMQA